MTETIRTAQQQWGPLLEAVGLPKITELTETTQLEGGRRCMPLSEFRKLVGRAGRAPGSEYSHEVPGTCLAGSAVLAWVTGGESRDYDYFAEDVATAQTLANYLLGKGFTVSGFQGNHDAVAELAGDDEWLPDAKDIRSWYCGRFRCSTGKHLPVMAADPLRSPPEELVRAINFERKGQQKRVQIVLLIRGTPQEVIDTFDFSVVQWAVQGDTIYWGQHTIQDMVRRKVRVVRIHHPMSTMRRLLKYSQRGYFFCNGALLEIAHGLSDYAHARVKAGLDPLDNQAISMD